MGPRTAWPGHPRGGWSQGPHNHFPTEGHAVHRRGLWDTHGNRREDRATLKAVLCLQVGVAITMP